MGRPVSEQVTNFADLLQRQRLHLGLTQVELAKRAQLSEHAISDIERGLKRPQPTMMRHLAQALELSAELTEQFEAARRTKCPPASLPEEQTPVPEPDLPHEPNLPAARTSFIGRARELAEVQRLLQSTRLLTLTGPGGTGKTRVALEAAAALHDRHPDGVFFVGLAPIADQRLVASSILQAVAIADGGRQPIQVLTNFLYSRRVLLILDNFEQVLGAAVDIGQLLVSCPRLHVLATSRAPLRLSGEREFPIPPLGRHESVRLFVDRASAVNADFTLTDGNAPDVAELCRQLDGLPLAIELAAARTRLLDPRAMLTRFGRHLSLLTDGARDAPARQQTLRNTIAWSYDLLEPDEQSLFRGLAVFVGGCTLDAAQAVCAPDASDTLDRIESLVAKNLVRPVPAAPGNVRITLLETMREFGLEQLAWTGELESVRRRHAAYFLALAEQAEPLLGGRSVCTWLNRLETEHDNLRSALDWSLGEHDRGAETALRLAGALGRFWWMAGHFGEGSRWLARALGGGPVGPAVRMKALHGAGWLAHLQRNSPAARTLLEESLAIAEERADDWWRAWVVHALGRVAYFEGDVQRAAELAQRSLTIAEPLGDAWLIAWTVHLRGLAAYIGGDYATANAHYERCLAMRRELGHLEGLVIVLVLKAMAAFRLGHSAEALALTREALDIARQLNSAWFFSSVLPIFASLAAEQQPERAARLGGAVDRSERISADTAHPNHRIAVRRRHADRPA